MEYFRCRDCVNILGVPVSADQTLIARHMGQNTKLDLGIIRVHKGVTLFRHKYLADLSSQFHADRNILQVRLGTADSSGGCDGLVEGSVDPSVLPDEAI